MNVACFSCMFCKSRDLTTCSHDITRTIPFVLYCTIPSVILFKYTQEPLSQCPATTNCNSPPLSKECTLYHPLSPPFYRVSPFLYSRGTQLSIFLAAFLYHPDFMTTSDYIARKCFNFRLP